MRTHSDPTRVSARSRVASPDTLLQLSDLLRRAASYEPASSLVLTGSDGGDHHLDYATLMRRAQHVAGSLSALGLQPGQPIAIQVTSTLDFLPVFWGAIWLGLVPCPVTAPQSDAQATQLAHILQTLGTPHVLANADFPRSLHGRIEPTIHALSTLSQGSTAVAQPCARTAPDALALLFPTSGSTGVPKLVALTNENLLSAMRAKNAIQRLTARDTSLNWVAFDHVAALLECHLLPMFAGAGQVHVDPAEVVSDALRFLIRIHEHRVSMTFAPNFLLSRIVDLVAGIDARQGSDKGLPKLDLSCVRHIISGGEAIVTQSGLSFLERLAPWGLLPSALWPAFGMTETCAGSVYSQSFPDADRGNEFASLGQAVAGLQMRIADEQDRPVSEGTTGELQLSGPMVFSRYLNNADATAAAFTPDGYLRTGDQGVIRDGRLTLVGRLKDSIIVNGVNYFSHTLEAALESVRGVCRGNIAAFPFRPAQSATERLAVLLCIEPDRRDAAALADLVTQVRRTTVGLWGFRPSLVLPVTEAELPKTSLGKIQRKVLRSKLESGGFEPEVRATEQALRAARGAFEPPVTPMELQVAECFAALFNLSPSEVSANDHFLDLGGTSLEMIQLKRDLTELAGGHEPTIAEIMAAGTIRHLAALCDAALCDVTKGSTGAPPTYSPLVRLQGSGHGTPLFCIHPGVGEVLVFMQLAQDFARERPVYGLRARGLNALEPHFASFAEMVESYLQAILQVQPEGPYALLGYSFGGAVAFELAKALEAKGARVVFVGSINGPAHLKPGRLEIDLAYTATNLAYLLGLFDQEQARRETARLREIGSPREALASLLRSASAARLRALDLNESRFLRWVDVAYSLVLLGRTYEPAGQVSRMHVMHAEPPPRYRDYDRDRWLDEKLRGWAPFSREPVRYLSVDGPHAQILDSQHAVVRHYIDTQLKSHES